MLENYLKNSIVIQNGKLNKNKTIDKLLSNIKLSYNVLQKNKPKLPSKQWRTNDNIIPFSQGNNKLPKSTYIVNLGCSELCPGRALGTCTHCNICYAHKAEQQYKEGTLLYRLLQTLRWNNLSAKEIANQLLTVSDNAKVNKMKHLRLNESGDAFTQKDVKKMSKIADILAKENIPTYTYTSRYDLNWNKKSKNLVVNGSEFMIDNCFTICKQHDDTMTYKCNGNCDSCDYCKTANNYTIYVQEHYKVDMKLDNGLEKYA